MLEIERLLGLSRLELTADIAGVSRSLRGRTLNAADWALAISAFVAAAKRVGQRRANVQDLNISAILALHEGGLFESSSRAPRLRDEVFLACYGSVLEGLQAHVVTLTERDAETLLVELEPVFRELDVSSSRLDSSGFPSGRPSAYRSELIVGAYEQFCTSYLLDHLTENGPVTTPPHLAVAIGVDLDKTLIPHAAHVVYVRDEDSGDLLARIPIWDYFSLYKRISGIVRPAPRIKREFVYWFDISKVGIDFRTVDSNMKLSDRVQAMRDALTKSIADVERRQRLELYRWRDQILRGDQLDDLVVGQFRALIRQTLAASADIPLVVEQFRQMYATDVIRERFSSNVIDPNSASEQLLAEIVAAYHDRKSRFEPLVFQEFTQRVLLRVADLQWALHLKRLDAAYPDATSLKGLWADVLEDFRSRAVESSAMMAEAVAREIVTYIFKAIP